MRRADARHTVVAAVLTCLRLAGLVIALCASTLAICVPRAAAVPLPPSGAPLPGSSVQGADGDQADAAPWIDWATLEATGRVGHTPDPNAHDTMFSGGDKEDAPGDWDIVTKAGGVTPSQENILDAWSSVDEAGADTFLHLAFARAAGTGTSYLTFELNRDSRTWHNGNTMIPCRLERRRADQLPAVGQRRERDRAALDHVGHRPGDGLRDEGLARERVGAHRERRRPGRRQRRVDRQLAARQLRRHARPLRVRRDVARPRRAARSDGRHALRRVHLGLDAFALVDVGELQHAGLRRAAADRGAPVRRRWREVLRRERGRRSGPGRDRPGAVQDLRRLQRQRRPRPRSSRSRSPTPMGAT